MHKFSYRSVLFLIAFISFAVYLATISIPSAIMFSFTSVMFIANNYLLKTNTEIRKLNITLLKENTEMVEKLKEAAIILAQKHTKTNKDIVVPPPRFKEHPYVQDEPPNNDTI